MAKLPIARIKPRDVKGRLAVAGAHARRGARHVPGVARWIWSCVLICGGGAYIAFRLYEWTQPAPAPYELPSRIELGHAADDLEIVDVPSPTGSGTIKSLARKHKPAPVTAE